ncbi:MAG: hypothetical protein PHV83_00555 [Bacteroidales bacterium]|nr:hypothetical protein [Bacteroidales bacterium]
MKIKNTYSIIVYLAINIILLTCLMSCHSYYRERLKKEVLKGVVTDKYIDEFGHDTNMILVDGYIKLPLTSWIKGSSNNLDTGNIWDYIELGDSVYKAEGSLKMKVIKPSGEYQVFDYYYEDGW